MDNFFYEHLIPITTPCGRCPVELTHTDSNSVAIWANAVLECGYKNGRNYTHFALRYWIRDFFEIGSDEFLEVFFNLC